MHAEFPPDFPLIRVIETVTFYEPVHCIMWRMERRCPNTTDQGSLCEGTNKRRFVFAQCQICAIDAPIGLRISDVAKDHLITNQILARFEFASEYQEHISPSDILSAIQKSGRADEMRIADALKALGATKEHTHDGTRWNGLRWRI